VRNGTTRNGAGRRGRCAGKTRVLDRHLSRDRPSSVTRELIVKTIEGSGFVASHVVFDVSRGPLGARRHAADPQGSDVETERVRFMQTPSDFTRRRDLDEDFAIHPSFLRPFFAAPAAFALSHSHQGKENEPCTSEAE